MTHEERARKWLEDLTIVGSLGGRPKMTTHPELAETLAAEFAAVAQEAREEVKLLTTAESGALRIATLERRVADLEAALREPLLLSECGPDTLKFTINPGTVIEVGPVGMKFYSRTPISVDAGGSVFTNDEAEAIADRILGKEGA